MLADVTGGAAGELAQALTRRMAEMKAAAERLQGFAFAPGEESPDLLDDEGDGSGTLRDMALRALARSADPINFALIEHLSESDATVGELARSLGLPRAAVSERVNDLLQVGLVARTHRGDGATLGPAGREIVELVTAVVEQGRRRT